MSEGVNGFENSDEEFLKLHYSRCKDFYLAFNTTIWSMPSLATTINIGVYFVLFDITKKMPNHILIFCLIILVLLNFVISLAVTRHRYMQMQFGNRMVEIEKMKSIPIIDLGGNSSLTKTKAGDYYVSAIWIITFISFIVLVGSIVDTFVIPITK